MYDYEIEVNVLGGLLLDNKKYDAISSIIDVEDFGKKLHQDIFREIETCVMKGERVDIQILSKMPKYKKQISEIISLTTQAISTNTVFFAKQLKELTVKRVLTELTESITTGINSGGEVSAILEHVENTISAIAISKKSYEIKTIKDFLHQAIQKIQHDHDTKGVPGLRTGFSGLDYILGGLQKQELLILGARPSIGKTAFALNIASNIIGNDKPVGFFSLEMSGVLLMQRLLCTHAMIDQSRIKSATLRELDMGNLHASCTALYEQKLYIYDYPNADLLDLKTKARVLKRSQDIQVLIIDYLGLIRMKADMPRWEKVGIISSELKALARELDIPILVLSQLGRQAEKKEPSLADLRDSGSVEQDADVVMFLHRERDETDTKLIISKNRNGGTGIMDLKFRPEITRFYEVQREKEAV